MKRLLWMAPLLALSLFPGSLRAQVAPTQQDTPEPPGMLDVLTVTDSIVWMFHVEVINRYCVLSFYGGDCASPFIDEPFTTHASRIPGRLRNRQIQFTAFNERVDTIPTHGRYYLDSARVFFPMMPDTMQIQWDWDRLQSKLRMKPVYKDAAILQNANVVDLEPTVVMDEKIGYRYGMWESPDYATEAFVWSMDVPVRARSLRFDEQTAMRIDWPTQWPEQVRYALRPQASVQSDDPLFRQIVEQWVGDPRRRPPAMVAKMLMGKLVDTFQPNGIAVDWNTPLPGSIRGLVPMYSINALEQMRGSSIDMPAVLVGLYRAAGIPARFVIGFDIGSSADGLDLPSRDPFEDCDLVEVEDAPQNPVVRGWAEFYLYDEATNTGVWVPVDPFRQQHNSSRVPSVDREWKFFGNFPCGAIRIPMTHHILSPYDDVAPVWPASFLSWDASPMPIDSTQYTVISVMEPPRRAGEPEWPKDSP